MATRREQKEQARAARLAKEQAAAQQAARKRRMQIFGGLIAAAVIVVAVIVVLSVGGSGSKQTTGKAVADSSGILTTSSGSDEYEVGLQHGANAKLVADKVDALLDGIPQSGTTLGDSSAKVTAYYYGDLECSVCQEFTLFDLPQFISSYVRTGKVKLTYRSFCTATCDNTALGAGSNKAEQVFEIQQVAAYAAGMQNKFWDYAERFYHQQGQEDTKYVTASYLLALAKQVPGLKVSTWQQDLKDPSLVDQLSTEDAEATKAKVEGTPTLIMKGPKGESEAPSYSYSSLVQAVKAVS